MRLPAGAGTTAEYTATLMCVHSYVRRAGNRRKRKEKLIWQTSGPATAREHGGGVELEFRFDVPPELPESSERSNDYHCWKLVVDSDHEPISYSRTFEIPVFATAEQAKLVQTDSEALGRTRASATVEEALTDPAVARKMRRKRGLSLDVRADWIRLYFHRGRQKAIAITLLVVGGPFMAVFWIPDPGLAAVFLRYVFGIAGAAMVAGALYIPLNTLDVRVNRKQISRIRSWCGLVLKRQSISPGELREITIEEGTSSSDQNKKTTYYRLVGKGDFGEFRFAESIDDRALLEALQRKIADFAGLGTRTAQH